MNLFTVEEHHEAFFVWRYALAKKMIKPRNNTLLHIDEHSDMSAPVMDHSIHKLNGHLKEIVDFTYRELNIASFIVPAVYQGLFDKVYWIKQKHNKTGSRGNDLYVRSHDDQGKRLITGNFSLLKSGETLADERPIVRYKFYKQHINEIGRMQNVMLDIDLDFYSSILNPLKNELVVEITKAEYDNFTTTPYHRMRFFDFGRVQAQKRGNRYFYLLNRYKDKYESPLKVDKKKIIERIEESAQHLSDKKIKPQMITVCRSRFSGYTPNDQWKFIEQELMKQLTNLYGDIDSHHVSELTALK